MNLSVHTLKHQLSAIMPDLTQDEAYTLATDIVMGRLPPDDSEGPADINLFIQNGEVMLA